MPVKLSRKMTTGDSSIFIGSPEPEKKKHSTFKGKFLNSKLTLEQWAEVLERYRKENPGAPDNDANVARAILSSYLGKKIEGRPVPDNFKRTEKKEKQEPPAKQPVKAPANAHHKPLDKVRLVTSDDAPAKEEKKDSGSIMDLL